MDFLKAVNIIGRDLEEAMALLEQLSGLSGPEKAEIELARSRVRSASDLLKLLPGMAATKEPVREPVTGHRPEPSPEPMAELQPESAGKPAAEHRPEPVAEKKEECRPEPAIEPVTRQKAQPAPEQESYPEPAKQHQPAQKSHEAARAILADRFVPSGTLGEKISTGRQDEVISTVIHSKPIEDIGSAIGMNDRFLFIRELFSGDTMAYSDTIRRLNAAASLGEAMRILDESTVMGSDPAAQSSFVDVVRRKFSLHV